MGGGASSSKQKYEPAPECTTSWETEARRAGWLPASEVEAAAASADYSRKPERALSHREAWASATDNAAVASRLSASSKGDIRVSEVLSCAAQPEVTSPSGFQTPVQIVGDSNFGLVLAADVGGTNSRFMLYRVGLDVPIVLRQTAPGELLFVRKYANVLFPCFADVVQEFLKDANEANVAEAGRLEPEVACLAVAGVAQQNLCRLTNLDWLIDGPALAERFGISYVEVINDFVAQGYGVLTLGDDEVLQMAGPPPIVGGTVGCIGAGTGLGQCFLTASPTGEYQCFPSEGGHQEFAPRGCGSDETQLELLKFLKVKFSGWNRVSAERVVSGKGLCNVYEFLAYQHPAKVDKKVHTEFLKDHKDASTISLNAHPGTLCHDALRIFAGCYGAVAGTFTLQIMPFGGLYLTGGVTQRLQQFLSEEGSFMEAYFDKGRVSPMLQDVPLFFVKGDEMGQKGAHLRAVRLLHRHRDHQEGLLIRSHTTTAPHLVAPRNVALASMLGALGKDGASAGVKPAISLRG